MRKFVRIMMSVVILIGLTASAYSQTLARMDSLVREALNQNPELQAYESAVLETETRISQAGALPDPVLSVGLLNVPTDSYTFDQEPMSGKKLTFTQPVPFPGKLGLKSDLVREDVKIAQWKHLQKKLEIIYRVRSAYYSIHYFDRALETLLKNQRILENFVNIATTKYSVGKGLQQDVLRAQVELSKFEDKIIEVRKNRESVVFRLNTLLGRSLASPFAVTESLKYNPVVMQHDSLLAAVEKRNPLMNIVKTLLKKNDVQNRLARRNYWPDLTFSLAYTQRDVLQNGNGGTDYVSGVVGIKLPLYFWQKQKKAVAQTKIAGKKISQTLENTRNSLLNDLNDAWQLFRKEESQIKLYKNGIIPQASQSLHSTISGYQTDKVDFLTMLNSLIVLFNYEKEYYKVISNYYTHIARINYLTASETE